MNLQAFSMQRQHRLAYNWLSILAFFTATLPRIYSTMVLPENLVTVPKDMTVIEDLDLAIVLFHTLGIRFPGTRLQG